MAAKAPRRLLLVHLRQVAALRNVHAQGEDDQVPGLAADQLLDLTVRDLSD